MVNKIEKIIKENELTLFEINELDNQVRIKVLAQPTCQQALREVIKLASILNEEKIDFKTTEDFTIVIK